MSRARAALPWLLALAVIGCTSLPKRLWRRWEDGMSIAVSDTLRTVWAVLVLLVLVEVGLGDLAVLRVLQVILGSGGGSSGGSSRFHGCRFQSVQKIRQIGSEL